MTEPRYLHPERRWVLLPLAFAAVMVAAVWLRYAGSWAETDTVALTTAARATGAEGTINPSAGGYRHGFSYPSLIVFVAAATGLSMATIQVTVLPWLLLLTAGVAFITFRAVLGSGRAGAICALLLLVQADFLFVNLRGSHEKVTWTLVLMLVYTLVASFRHHRFAGAAPLTIVFYLAGFGLIATSAFFASSLIASFALSFLGGLVVIRWFPRDRELRPFLRRLGYVFATMSVFSYLYVAYLFPPVRTSLGDLEGVADRIAALYLNVESSTKSTPAQPGCGDSTGGATAATATLTTAVASPYKQVSAAWTNTTTYFALTGFTWVLIAAAAIAWLVNLGRFFRRGVSHGEAPLFLVWAFAGVTGLQIAGAVVVDASGALGSNMQLRLFPPFVLLVIPLVVGTLQRLRWPGSRAGVRGVAAGAGVLCFAYFAGAAYLKATSDPVVSNKWIGYSRSEAVVFGWANAHLGGVTIWGEFDERITTANVMVADDRPESAANSPIWVSGSQVRSGTRYVMVSDVTTRRVLRLGEIMPDTGGDDRIYDNGKVQVTHRVPDSPYVP